MTSRVNKLLLCPQNQENYKKDDKQSIFAYAIKLIGKTFEDILVENGISGDDLLFLRLQSLSNKGLLGNLVEEAWFGYPSNSRQEADFDKIGVELKTTPFDKSGDDIKPGEIVSVTQIDFTVPQEQNFYNTHLLNKIKSILFVYYLREKAKVKYIQSKLFYKVHYVFMLEPSLTDLAIIESDYKLLYGFIVRGEAHKLTRRYGIYLGVVTKGSKGDKKVRQFYGNHELTSKRAFALKIPYLTFILRVITGREDNNYGSIIRTPKELRSKTIDEILSERLEPYIGLEIHDIWNRVKFHEDKNINQLSTAKNKDAIISCRMLGVKSNRVEEFVKAGIVPKIIKFRLQKKDNQEFRLEDFKFLDLDTEEYDSDDINPAEDEERQGWEASALFSYLADRQYFLMVFWETSKGTIFKGYQLWSMPDSDLEIVHQAWIQTKNIVREGIEFTVKYKNNGELWRIENNLPGISDNGVFHIRPHSQESYYEIDGKKYGNGSISDSDILPNGDRITKQAYWLNRSYIETQLRPELVKKYV